jgi:hypothetical protein
MQQSQFAQLVDAISGVDQLLETLAERLTPILNPGCHGSEGDCSSPQQSPLAEQVERVRSMGQVIRDLMDRIEV